MILEQAPMLLLLVVDWAVVAKLQVMVVQLAEVQVVVQVVETQIKQVLVVHLMKVVMVVIQVAHLQVL